MLENKYVEPELRYIETSRFELRKDKESYHKEQLDVDEEEADKFTSLVESIRDLGILQPIYVIESKSGGYEVIDGGRRLRAARFLGLQKVPAMVYQGSDAESEIRKRSLIANIHRKDLSKEEKGEGLANYYKSGGVDPINAISYLNTLRQRRQKSDEMSRASGHSVSHSDIIKHNPQEWESFLVLHKRLGIPRMTQYEWLTTVIYVDKSVRESKEYQNLSKADQKYFVQTEVRNDPKTQKELAKDLYTLDEEREKAKAAEKKDIVTAKISAAKVKVKKERKLRQYFPNTQDKRKKKSKESFSYGKINGAINTLWSRLTGIKEMPLQTDDIMLDHIKPTREEFNEYLAALDENERIQQYNWLAMLEKAMDDRMKLLDTATKNQR